MLEPKKEKQEVVFPVDGIALLEAELRRTVKQTLSNIEIILDKDEREFREIRPIILDNLNSLYRFAKTLLMSQHG